MLKPQVLTFPSEQPSAGARVRRFAPGNFISTIKHDACSDVALLWHFKSALSEADCACANKPRHCQRAKYRKAPCTNRRQGALDSSFGEPAASVQVSELP